MGDEIVKVMIVDDHDMVRKGLKAYLQTELSITIVGEAGSGNEAVEKARILQPDVILMDLIMENGNGIEATKRILDEHSECKVIILTSYYDDEQVFPAIEAGATSYLLKTASSDDIMEAIHKAVTGNAVIDAKVAQKMMMQFRQKSTLHDQLTKREMEVLKLISQGKSNATIADELFIGVKTVKTHVSSIFAKLDVVDRTQAAVYAHQHKMF